MKPPLLAAIMLCTLLHSQRAQAQVLTVTYTVSSHHGYNISCFGGADGAIDVTVTGGTAPYTYEWSNNATTQDLTGLVAGYYKVKVRDATNTMKEAQTTLTEPGALSARADVYEYPNGYNVSCHSCYNGSVDVTILGGVAPYTMEWADAASTEDRSSLGADNYSFTLTDNNGCEYRSETYTLQQPERTDWTMGGNAGTNPATQYIGTSDNKDVVFKSNAAEAWRLLATGEVKASSLASNAGYSLLAVDEQGILKRFSGVGTGDLPEGCPAGDRLPWQLCGNEITTDQFIGSINAAPLVFKTDNDERMRFKADGTISVNGGALTNDQPGGSLMVMKQGWNDWLTFQFDDHEGIWRFHNGEDQNNLSLSYTDADGDSPGGGLTLWNDGKVSIGAEGVTERPDGYGLYVWKGILTEKLKVALKTGDWSDHVFAPDYALMPLDEVERFIDLNGHLPGVPSAECMAETGLDVAKTDAMLMAKVEELTLYMIELKREIEDLKTRQPVDH